MCENRICVVNYKQGPCFLLLMPTSSHPDGLKRIRKKKKKNPKNKTRTIVKLITVFRKKKKIVAGGEIPGC